MRRQEHDARTLEMHPQDAAVRNLQEGMTVRVFNDRGAFTLPVKISHNVAQEPSVPFGAGGTNCPGAKATLTMSPRRN